MLISIVIIGVLIYGICKLDRSYEYPEKSSQTTQQDIQHTQAAKADQQNSCPEVN